MLSLYDLFRTDFGHLGFDADLPVNCFVRTHLKTEESISLVSEEKHPAGNIKIRLLCDTDANVKFMALYLPPLSPFSSLLEMTMDIVNQHESLLQYFSKFPRVSGGHAGDSMVLPSLLLDQVFSRKIYIYADGELSNFEIQVLNNLGVKLKLNVVFRGLKYLHAQVPLSFISHDFFDQQLIVTPLVQKFHRLGCRVWYSHYDLRPGQTLEDVFQKAISDCKYFTPVLTERYLADGKNTDSWTYKEFHLAKKLKKPMIAIGYGINHNDVVKYNSYLATKLWVDGNADQSVSRVVAQLKKGIG